MVAKRLSILVFTEDSSSDAFQTVVALVKKALGCGLPGFQTHQVDFSPSDPAVREVVHANQWKAKGAGSRNAYVKMINSMATQVAMENGLVLFHFDADVPFGSAGPSENRLKFEKLVLASLTERLRQPVRATVAAPSSEEIRRRLGKVVQMVPHYAIEAWLYQNTEEARKLCQDSRYPGDLERFEEWSRNPASLEDLINPKSLISFGSKHNLRLASSAFPAEKVHAVGKSFTVFVSELAMKDETLRCFGSAGLA